MTTSTPPDALPASKEAEARRILDEIGFAMESRGYAHMTNGRDIGALLDRLEQFEAHPPTDAGVSELQLVWMQNLIGFVKGQFPATDEWKTIFVEKLAALSTAIPAGDGVPTHRHLKSGHMVRVIGIGRMQMSTVPAEDMDDVVIYEHDGNLWVRAHWEFNDGRFAPLSTVSTAGKG